MNYEKWLELKEAEESKEYKWHCIGLGLMALIMAGYGPVTGRFEWVEALISGFCPYLMCVWAARPHKERADSYERKYRTHTPYISVKKVNAELLALEFDPGQVTIYYNSVAGHESLTVDREFVKIKPSDTDISYVKYQLATNNNTRKQKIKFVNLYLEESMQEKLLNLVKEAG